MGIIDNKQAWVLAKTNAGEIARVVPVQELWNGYGSLLRIYLNEGEVPSVILKEVVLPEGLEQSISHQRKHRSYEVERTWYTQHATRCDEDCRVASCFAVKEDAGRSWMLLEDLAVSGFQPNPYPSAEQAKAGLRWLAHFHSEFLNNDIHDLWEQGCYWHLDTRQDEYLRMPSGPLKDLASSFDKLLKSARYQTLVHGDAKPPNFCWTSDNHAAAVDFQYVGKGCGIRDVCLFLERSLLREGCAEVGDPWLDLYFAYLKEAMEEDGHEGFEELEREWRQLFCIAWSDYSRFRQGWANTNTLHPYSREMLKKAELVLRSSP